MTAYAAEIGGELLVGRDKIVTNRARLLYPIQPPPWWEAGERFIADLAAMPWLRTSGEPELGWTIIGAAMWDDAVTIALNRRGTVTTTWEDIETAAHELARRAGRDVAAQVIMGRAYKTVNEAIRSAGDTAIGLDEPWSTIAAIAEDTSEHMRGIACILSACSDLEDQPAPTRRNSQTTLADLRRWATRSVAMFSRGYLVEEPSDRGPVALSKRSR
jgi:hypothetical protein